MIHPYSHLAIRPFLFFGQALKRRVDSADEDRVASFSESLTKGMKGLAVALLMVGCGGTDEAWPPPPQNKQEQLLIDSARRAVNQFDGWAEVVWVVERQGKQWRVQAWQIVHPDAKGKMRCAPWAVRGIVLDDDGKVLEYRNHL